MRRLLANLAAIFVLVLLLAAPGVFSNNLVEFGGDKLGFKIYNKSGNFSQFLKLEEIQIGDIAKFNLEFSTFGDRPALYKPILEVENIKELPKTISIFNHDPQVVIFFNIGGETYGPETLEILPRQKVGINLLVPPTAQIKTASFSLKSDQ